MDWIILFVNSIDYKIPHFSVDFSLSHLISQLSLTKRELSEAKNILCISEERRQIIFFCSFII